MKIKRKYIILIIVLALIGYYGPSIFKIVKYIHKPERDFNRYMWLFNDSAKTKIDSIVFFGDIRKRDALYNYIYDGNYLLSIWEFKDLEETDMKYDLIKRNVYLNDIKFESGEIFNEEETKLPKITTKLEFKFKNPKMDVNLDNTSEIYRTIDSTNYKGFFGKINKMSFSDANGEHLILFEYKEPKKTLLLMYKARQSFFVIIVDSKQEFDENIINIFNLK